ncbi:45907_t:CDS:1 [Gigaspora margarita]|uniref:45907_t:CDS:1 n=1 Tax=Gigaspora margarita TaxID=4874 RepID=A0ABN7WXF0_GIGMA|nr:45907_t:CDS:1 [Gigaspora margarita]
MQKKSRMHIGDKISLCDQLKFNTQIDSLNQLYQTQIPQMPKFWS